MKPQIYFKLTNYLWACYILIVCLLVIFYNGIHFASINYFQAAANWLTAKPLYTTGNQTFYYFPQTAIFYTLWAKLPSLIYEISWRILTISTLWYAIYRFSRLNQYGLYQKFFFIISIITMLLGFFAVLKGELSLIAVICMLLVTVEILDERWWFVAFYLIVGFSLNPAMFIMFLLARAVYRSLLYRVLILLVISFIIPFFFQSASYVLQQYAEMHQLFRPVDVANLQWSHLFSIVGHLGFFITTQMQIAITFIVGILFFFYCIKMKNRFAHPQFCVFLFLISAIFLILFNPHTTLADYIVLGPAIGFFFSIALQEKITWLIVFLAFIILGILCQMLLGFVINPVKISWIAPLMTLGFFIIVVIKLPLLYSHKIKFVIGCKTN